MGDIENEFSSTGVTDLGQDVSAFDAPGLTPQDHAEHIANLVARALEQTGLIQIVEIRAAAGQIHFLGRVRGEDERRFIHKLVDKLLRVLEGECDCFVGKHYFLKNEKLVYGWNFSFSSSDLQEVSHTICNAADSLAPRHEVLEAPLMGSGPAQARPGDKSRGAMPVRGA